MKDFSHSSIFLVYFIMANSRNYYSTLSEQFGISLGDNMLKLFANHI